MQFSKAKNKPSVYPLYLTEDKCAILEIKKNSKLENCQIQKFINSPSRIPEKLKHATRSVFMTIRFLIRGWGRGTAMLVWLKQAAYVSGK